MQGLRSLVVLVSEDERQRFLRMCPEAELNGGALEAVSYGKGVTAREAAVRFKDGVGDVLVGTVSQYGEGVDLPNRIAPVIFYLRPAYPNPYEPEAQFEASRYGSRRFAVWNWRVMNDLLQVRGRNIRSVNDEGVTFLISQQFRKFARPTLPKWLLPAYVADKSMEECVDDAMRLLV
jgi:Rad3-related DNA helicase